MLITNLIATSSDRMATGISPVGIPFGHYIKQAKSLSTKTKVAT